MQDGARLAGSQNDSSETFNPRLSSVAIGRCQAIPTDAVRRLIVSNSVQGRSERCSRVHGRSRYASLFPRKRLDGALIGALPVQELLETSIGCTCGESIFANETLLFVC